MSSAVRLTAIVVVSFSALSTLAALTPASALAAGCTESWASPVSGEWNEAANWSPAKVPTFGDEVCITVTGASPYTVLVHGGADARTLTLGATTGSTQQTLLVQTYGSPGLVKEAELHLEENSTINREGVLELENIAGEGVAQVTTPATGATLSNQGKVTASASPGGIDLLGISLTNETSGTVEAASGTLDLHNYGSHVLNEGAFKVAAGATLGDEENPGTFLNKGTVANSGTFELFATAWTQDGTDTGNPVRLNGSNDSLDYEGGSGNFTFNPAGCCAVLSGKIPTGQTVALETVSGQVHVYLSGTVVNEGTLALISAPTADESSLLAENSSSQLDNKGLLSVQAESSFPDYVEVPLTNAPSGTVEVKSGDLQLRKDVINEGAFTVASGATVEDVLNAGTFANNGTVFDSGTFITEVPTTNEGTLQIASSASVVAGLGGLLTNAANGTIRTDIASETKFGTIKVNRGTFNPGGTIFPNLVEGYEPPVSTEFDVITSGASITGTFATVANGFEGIYSIPDTIAVKLIAPLCPASPAIGAQPSPQTVTAPTAASFKVKEGTVPANCSAASIQWEVSTNKGTSWSKVSASNATGATSETLQLSPTATGESGNEYRAALTNHHGTTVSSPALLTVNAPSTCHEAPSITEQPNSQTVTAPNPATFKAAASTPAGCSAPTVQWYSEAPGGSSFSPVSSAISTSFTTPPTATAQSGTKYEAIFKNSFGQQTTNAATLTVNLAAGTPIIAGIFPNHGRPGSVVVIFGSNLSAVKTVDFGSTPARFVVLGSHFIIALVPPHANGTVDVTVHTTTLTSPITQADQFTFTSGGAA